MSAGGASVWVDAKWLARFVRDCDAEAFARRVRRREAMLHAVCRREIGVFYAAEDGFRAAFLLLFRRADRFRIAEPDALLYGFFSVTILVTAPFLVLFATDVSGVTAGSMEGTVEVTCAAAGQGVEVEFLSRMEGGSLRTLVSGLTVIAGAGVSRS